MAALDEAMGGLAIAQVHVTWTEESEASDREVIEVLEKVDKLLRSEPMLGHPLTIASMLKALPGEGSVAERASMMELLPPPLKQNFYQPDRRFAKATFRIKDTGIAAYSPVFARVTSGLKQIASEHPGFHLDLDGRPIWRWRNLFQIVEDLGSSLGSEAVIILFVLGQLSDPFASVLSPLSQTFFHWLPVQRGFGSSRCRSTLSASVPLPFVWESQWMIPFTS